jgi:hypothetical protein
LTEAQVRLELLQFVLHTGQRSGSPHARDGRRVLTLEAVGVPRLGEAAR